ncbi:MAG: hypothetical protein ACP5HJ_03350, partial [Candidatus Micrarchaeia archaeon]
MKLQSAIEYLMTYGWAILIIAVVLGALYQYVITPSSLAPDFCNFKYGPTCIGVMLFSSNTASNIAIVAINSLPFPIKNATLIVQPVGITQGNVSALCSPSFIQPGGTFFCTINISGSKANLNSLYSFPMWIKLYDCGTAPGWFSAKSCSGALIETYVGLMQAHARTGAISSQNILITLTASPTSVPANNLNYSKLIANVKIFGQNIKGATVSFTVNSSTATIFPTTQITDSNG